MESYDFVVTVAWKRYFFLPFFAGAFFAGFAGGFLALGAGFGAGLLLAGAAFAAGLAADLASAAFTGPGPGFAAVTGAAFAGAGGVTGADGVATAGAVLGFLPRFFGPSAGAACACAGAAAAGAVASFFARPLLGGGGGGGGSGGE